MQTFGFSHNRSVDRSVDRHVMFEVGQRRVEVRELVACPGADPELITLAKYSEIIAPG